MTPAPISTPEPGRSAAFITYLLYLFSIPSAGVFALIGVIVAYVSRSEAQGMALTHLNDQIRIWWTAFWWTIVIWIIGFIGMLTIVVLIGIPIVMIAGLASFILLVWFTVKSLLGLLALLDGRGR